MNKKKFSSLPSDLQEIIIHGIEAMNTWMLCECDSKNSFYLKLTFIAAIFFLVCLVLIAEGSVCLDEAYSIFLLFDSYNRDPGMWNEQPNDGQVQYGKAEIKIN